MGRVPENVLNARRSPAEALCDLIKKHDAMPPNDPNLPALGRMIRQLAAEVTHPVARCPRSARLGEL
jgi:hypothetical protein